MAFLYFWMDAKPFFVPIDAQAIQPDETASLQDFFERCKEGNASGCFFVRIVSNVYLDSIDPSLEENEHPPTNLRVGDAFLGKVYNAVRNSPAWKETVLVITFDEHGGFYDPVPPPFNVPRPDDSPLNRPVSHFNFDRLGPRVPTIIVSPFVQRGGIVSQGADGRIFEHSSIPATIKKLFGLSNFLTKRDAWAATFDNVISLQAPRSDCPQRL